MTNILYNNKNCPFCLRARNALFHANISYELIEVDFDNKSPILFELSPKGTVPVFVNTEGNVIDESIDIVRYCAQYATNSNWIILTKDEEENYLNTFQTNFLNAYRSNLNNPDNMTSASLIDEYLNNLDKQLQNSKFIAGNMISMLDIMTSPFISRFLQKNTKEAEQYINITNWLKDSLQN